MGAADRGAAARWPVPADLRQGSASSSDVIEISKSGKRSTEEGDGGVRV